MFKKIKESLNFLSIIAIFFTAFSAVAVCMSFYGNEVILSNVHPTIIFIATLLLTLVIASFIHLVCRTITDSIAKSITDPIDKINLYNLTEQDLKSSYPELKPMLERIMAQQDEIDRQLKKVSRQKVYLDAMSDNPKESTQVEAAQLRAEFSANVSHELKTPLTTILGYSQIINNGIASPEDIKGFTNKIEKEATRLITLIDDIMKLSQLDESNQAIEKQNVDLKEIAEEVTESLKNKAEERGVKVSVSGNMTVYANLVQMTELIYNLCDNAIKYNVEGGTVEVLLKDNTLSVKDTGIGIPEDSIPRIFERFYRVDKSHSKSVNGTGLGLSIVKHIARRNNAALEVKSDLGKGTEIMVTFE